MSTEVSSNAAGNTGQDVYVDAGYNIGGMSFPGESPTASS